MRTSFPHFSILILPDKSGADRNPLWQSYRVCRIDRKRKVIDAYCGIGTIGMAAAGKAGSVIGVEVNRDAVRDAVTNAKRNNMKNITFYNEDAGEFMVKMAAQGETADVVFMDPPRAGSDEAFLSSLLQLSPKRVVYISCNPVTQARDLKYLISHGYRVERCQPVDMFPWTYHIENIVSMTRKDK